MLSLISQLTLSAWLLKRFAPAGLLAILPSLLVLGGVGLLLGLGLAAGLFVKGSDGALRYSLHRTAGELLYLPLPDQARPRIKAVFDMVAQRAGQALASLAILGLAAFGVARGGVALLLIVLSMLWAALAIELRRLYVGVLRDNLGGQQTPSAMVFPEFDMASLETLVAALDSQDDREVLAALTMLEREQKLHLVPTLILYHPSEQVVERALEAFARAGRSDSLRVIERLYEHASARVRSAAIAARSLLAPDGKRLFLRLSMEDSPEVRATIVVHLVASGEIVGAEARDRLHQILEHGRPETQVALARAMAWRSDRRFDPVLLQLTAADELDVRLAALAAIARHPSPVFVPALIDALADERSRPAARKALRHYDGAGLTALREALADESRAPLLRWELPRALALFEPQGAARALIAQLLVEADGMVRYRIIRALESVVAAHPSVALDEPALAGVTRGTITRAYRYLDERLTLERGAHERAARKTPGYALLLHVLRDKELHARDRLFRLLGLANPEADFPGIRRGLQSSASKVRATSVELALTLLKEPVRSAVNGLIDDMPDADRLGWVGTFYQPRALSYEELLQHMLESESASVQDVTAYHVGELGLSGLRPLIAAIAAAHPGRAELTRSLSRLPVLAGAHAQ
jgi:AAA family ATP:ADP antiporter